MCLPAYVLNNILGINNLWVMEHDVEWTTMSFNYKDSFVFNNLIFDESDKVLSYRKDDFISQR